MAPVDKMKKKPKLLVMLDMNGVLILRSSPQHAALRAHIDIFVDTLWKHYPRIQVAVWSSMMMHNLMPLVDKVFGSHRRHELAFVWDQSNCTERHVDWMKKALLRKDMKWFEKTEWAKYFPDRMLLVDDDPVKCTKNPAGSAIHPSTFDGSEDNELLRMARYIDLMASSDTTKVTDYVLAHPFDETFKGEMTREMVESIGDSRIETRMPSPSEFIVARAEPAQPEMTAEDIQGANMIEIYMPDLDAWLPQAAKDLEELPNGTMRIKVEGEEEYVVPAEWVRDLEVQAAQPKGKKQRVSQDRELVRQESWLQAAEEAEVDEDSAPAKRKAPSWWGFDGDDAATKPEAPKAAAAPPRIEIPAPWRKLESRSHPGNFYYYNPETGKSSFDVPR